MKNIWRLWTLLVVLFATLSSPFSASASAAEGDWTTNIASTRLSDAKLKSIQPDVAQLDVTTRQSITAQPTTNPLATWFSGLEVDINETFASRYWGSIVGGIFYTGGAVSFTDLNISRKDDWGSTYFLLGTINPLDTLKYDHGGGTEYYMGVGRGFDLWKNSEGTPAVKFDIFVMYDELSNVLRFNDDVILFKTRTEFTQVSFAQPYVETYHWEKSGDKSPSVGNFYRGGIKRVQPLGLNINGDELKIGIDASVGYSGEGLFGCGEGLAYYRLILDTTFKLTDHISLTPAIIGQLPGGQDKPSFVDHWRLFYNFGLRYKF